MMNKQQENAKYIREEQQKTGMEAEEVSVFARRTTTHEQLY